MMSRVRNFVVNRKADDAENYEAKRRVFNFQPPPPLKISNSNYAREETFKKVSLNLLSRFEALELSAAETIQSTLINPEDRSAFYEALRFRLALLARQEAHTASLVRQIHRVFGEELRNMCHHHHVPTNSQTLVGIGEQPGKLHFQSSSSSFHQPPPITPRNDHISSTRVYGGYHNNNMGPTPPRRRSFFPDAGGEGNSADVRPPKIRNIDWQLANAVQQVVSLTLDGPPPTEKRDFACYEPPTTPMHCQAV